MGTSKGYGGAPSGLVPSWIDDTTPVTDLPMTGPDGDEVGAEAPPGMVPTVPPVAPDASSSGPLRTAKANFTRFVRSGDSDTLRRSISQYVRNGIGSSRKAARRMGASRVAGTQLLQVIRDVNRQGAVAALQKLNLQHLAGRPAADVFVAMLETICPPGGRIDEAIARQAMLDAIADLADAGAEKFEDLTPEQLSEFFQSFVIYTIEGRVIADIGTHAIDFPETVDGVEQVQEQLHGFVSGCVRGHLGDHFDGLAQKTDEQVKATVERIFEAAFDLVSALAGEVE